MHEDQESARFLVRPDVPGGRWAVLVGRRIIQKKKFVTIETEDGEPIGDIAWKPLVVILAAVTLFGFLLPIAGMFITLPVLVLVSAWASDEFSLKGTIINAVILDVFSWVIFIKGLGLTIPLLPAFMTATAA